MKRPNILLLYTDQQRWDALGANDNPDIQTPHLDELARGGVSFNHPFVQNPLCMPSRVSMLSGRYPSSLGITHMGVNVPEELPLLPHLLAPYGYTCANFGKLHLSPHANRDHREPHPKYGFDQLEVSDEPGVYEDAYRAWVEMRDPSQLGHLSVGLPPARKAWQETLNVYDPVPHPERGPLSGERDDFSGPICSPIPEELTHSAFVADRSIDFLKRHAGQQPFLCVAGFYAPHAPWVVPQRFLDQYDPATFTLPSMSADLNARRMGYRFSDAHLRAARHGYYAAVSEVDFHVGRILRALESLGLKDDTIVVHTSDHGEWLGQHCKFGKGYPGDDLVTRVPLLLRYPEHVAAGGCVDRVVEAVDIVPTLLKLAGIQKPSALQGEPLPLSSEDAYTKTGALTEGRGWKTLRTPGYRYLIHGDGREVLSRLGGKNSGYDDSDVSGDVAYKDTLANHRQALLMRLVSAERPLPRDWTY